MKFPHASEEEIKYSNPKILTPKSQITNPKSKILFVLLHFNLDVDLFYGDCK